MLIGSALLALAACSSVPDWANPVSWYDGVFGDDTQPSSGQSTPSSAGEKRADEASRRAPPRAGSVPDRPRAETTREQRANLVAGLAADKESARYTDEDLRGRPATAGEGTPAPAAPPAAVAPATPAPVPAPAPTPPVPAPVASAPPQPQPAAIPSPVPLTQAPVPAASTPVPAPMASGGLTSPPRVSYPTMPPAPTGGVVQPLRDTVALDQSYRSALMASAATVTTAPANTGFQPARPAAMGQVATNVPQNVMQTYQSPPVPAALPYAPAPTGPAMAPIRATGVATPNPQGIFNRAGSRLAAQIPFGAGSSRLGSRDMDMISTALAEHNTRGGTIRVIGFSKAGNSAQSKLNAFHLAQARADAVAEALIREGAKVNFVFVEARTDVSGAPENRVDLYLEN